jgi:SAM-dependent methyltransferase
MNPTATELVTLARQSLAAGERDRAAVCLRAALQIEPANLDAHNLREQEQLADFMSGWTGVNALISKDDDIFRFFAGHPTSTNPLRDYLADGWRTLSELMWLLEKHDLPLSKVTSFLEFASGFGRFTRHLVKRLPAGALTVSDIVPEAMQFLPAQFPVQAIASTHSPDDLVLPRQYQVIFVLSLFSHLPAATWSRWLARLWAATAPGGLLVFTTHGEHCAERAKVTLNPDGFAFFGGSESTALDQAEYGVSYTSEAFVRAAVRAHAPGAVHTFMQDHFWSQQDAHILRRPG